MTTPANDATPPLSRREARELANAAADPQTSPVPAPQVPAPEVPAPAVPAVTAPQVPAPAVPAVQAPQVPAPAVPASAVPAAAEPTRAQEALRAEAESLFPRRGEVSNIATRPEAAEPAGETQLHDLFDAKSVDRPKRRGGCLVPLLILLLVLGGLTGGGFWAWNTYGTQIQEFFGKKTVQEYGPGEANGDVTFTVHKGDGGYAISERLFEAGVTKAPMSFYDYVRANEPALTFYPGDFPLQQKMTSKAVAAILGDANNAITSKILIREGETLATILPVLSERLNIPLADFQAAVADPSQYGVPAASLEGWLFPLTYDFPDNVTAHDVIAEMVKQTVQTLDSVGVPVDRRQEILTIASIIQREAGQGDMGKVSRVIYNRLGPDNVETHGLLQMDSTVAYGVGKLHDGVVATTDEDRANDNPYNTYLHAGLPAGPISNSGKAAIDAAMHPADGPWFYFVTVNLNTGETLFAETYAEQQQNEKVWHEWCAANPDSGCY